MPQPWVTGPVFIFVGVGVETTPQGPVGGYSNASVIQPTSVHAGRRPVLLGTAEAGPRVVKRPFFRQLKTDVSGDVADDVCFTGEDALIFADVNWWDESVYRRISSRPFYFRNRGVVDSLSVGTLMQREFCTYRLYLYFPYAQKPIFSQAPGAVPNILSNPDLRAAGLSGTRRMPDLTVPVANGAMPTGYRFFSTYLIGPDTLDPLGTRARKISLAWHAIPQATATDGPSPKLYDESITELFGGPISGSPPVGTAGAYIRG